MLRLFGKFNLKLTQNVDEKYLSYQAEKERTFDELSLFSALDLSAILENTVALVYAMYINRVL